MSVKCTILLSFLGWDLISYSVSAAGLSKLATDTCQIYVAQSSIPGIGLGIFAGRNFEKGDMILKADGPSIPIVDPDFSKRSMETWLDLFLSYVWDGGISDPALFESNYTLEFSSAALPNSHPILNNMEVSHPAVVPYEESLDRMDSPGAGAISNYMGRNIVATKDIKEGKEIFLRYPDSYMDALSVKYDLPNKYNYQDAAKIFKKLLGTASTRYSDWQQSLWYASAHNKTLRLLPSSQNDVDRIIEFSKGRLDTETITTTIAEIISVEKRSVEWLNKYGACLDNIVPGKSTNPRAGKGAIAKRHILQGSIVSPVPVLHITDRDALRNPAFSGDKWQLLLNYCLGHDQSSLLLCPITNAVLVNHCSERKPDAHPCGPNGKTPNARYKWANFDHSTEKLLTKTIHDMQQHIGRGLSLEIVATRDVTPGEEIFIDYGISWEDAWDQHTNSWKPLPNYQRHNWSNINELNKDLKPLPVATNLGKKHISTDPHRALFTGCYYHEENDLDWKVLRKSTVQNIFDKVEKPWIEMPIEYTFEKFGRDYGNKFIVNEGGTYSDGDFWPCVVMANPKHNGSENDRYIVRIVQSPYHDDTVWEELNLPRIILNYPRRSIRHFYLPYKSDIWLPGAFRHHINLPDHLFPSHWKDKQR